MTLSDTQLEYFRHNGFLVLPEFFPADLMGDVRDEMHTCITEQPWLQPAHGSLISHQSLMPIIEQLCGPGFHFHHLNTYFQIEGCAGVPWHNDFEQSLLPMPRRDDNQNVIVLIYPDGLNGEVGDLAVVPGTQHLMAAWDAYEFLGTSTLPDEVVVDELPPGSAVICHTGLIHCRRPNPGPGPRYFCDVSYVSGGMLWPASCQHDWRRMYKDCLRLGYDQNGRYRHLFECGDFFDPSKTQEDMAALSQTEIYQRMQQTLIQN